MMMTMVMMSMSVGMTSVVMVTSIMAAMRKTGRAMMVVAVVLVPSVMMIITPMMGMHNHF